MSCKPTHPCHVWFPPDKLAWFEDFEAAKPETSNSPPILWSYVSSVRGPSAYYLPLIGVANDAAGGEWRHMRNLVGRLLRENRGQDLIEYAFLAAFISLSVAAGLSQVGVSLDNWYAAMADLITTAKSNYSPTGIGASGGKCL